MNSMFFCSRQTLPSSSYVLAHPRLEDALLGSPRNSSAISAQTWIFASGFNSITPELFGSMESISCFQYGSVKLAPRHHGPFPIAQVISPVTYKLTLPHQWTIHPVFHALLLTPYSKTKEHGENYSWPPPDLMGDAEQYEVEAIRSH